VRPGFVSFAKNKKYHIYDFVQNYTFRVKNAPYNIKAICSDQLPKNSYCYDSNGKIFVRIDKHEFEILGDVKFKLLCGEVCCGTDRMAIFFTTDDENFLYVAYADYDFKDITVEKVIGEGNYQQQFVLRDLPQKDLTVAKIVENVLIAFKT
jgi:hypothetical protein